MSRAPRAAGRRAAALLLLAFSTLSTGVGPLPAQAGSPEHHAHHGPAARPDTHGPIGVMGDHLHPQGEWMLSYRSMFMEMDGNRSGSSRDRTPEVLADYPVAPTDMQMFMSMFGLMVAPHDAVTVMLMLPVTVKEMHHVTRAGGSFGTETSGIGDLRVAGLVGLWENDIHHLHANLGLSIPTGSTVKRDATPMGKVRLPYPMQLGSGSWDLLPGLTYTGAADELSWGSQVLATLRTADNDRGYRLGHAYEATAWAARPWADWVSTSMRLLWQQWFDIEGSDPTLNPAVVPTADPDRRAGRLLEMLLGANLLVTDGPLAAHRFALEFGFPLYQDLDGPQLETDWKLIAGWQLAF